MTVRNGGVDERFHVQSLYFFVWGILMSGGEIGQTGGVLEPEPKYSLRGVVGKGAQLNVPSAISVHQNASSLPCRGV